MKNGMNAFLSEFALAEHKEYLFALKSRASVYSKSGIDLPSMRNRAADGSRVSYGEAKDIKELLLDIKMHEIYFNSFGASFVPCTAVRKSFGSENNFAFELIKLSEQTKCGFACIYSDRYGRIRFCGEKDLPENAAVHLAVDLCEHAYFRDYGFKKAEYLRAALAHLDFSVINNYYLSQKR